jgi:2-oxoglutarate dehydrogenase E1 component
LEEFFQGFDFGMTLIMRKTSGTNCNFAATNADVSLISDKIHKFNVLKLLMDAPYTGHLFTKQVKKTFHLNTKYKLWTFNCRFKRFFAAKVSNPAVLTSGNNNSFRYDIVQHIGVEYMYIRNPEMLSGFKKLE